MKSYFNAQRRTQDFEKGGGGARNFRKFERNIYQNLKLSHLNFVLYFAQNQVKSKKKKGLHSNFVPFFALLFRSLPKYQVISSSEPDAQLAEGGACLNFPHFSKQFCNPGDPKGGAMAQCPPPLNPPLLLPLDHISHMFKAIWKN